MAEPCACVADDRSRRAAGRLPAGCHCADYPPAERCDCAELCGPAQAGPAGWQRPVDWLTGIPVVVSPHVPPDTVLLFSGDLRPRLIDGPGPPGQFVDRILIRPEQVAKLTIAPPRRPWWAKAYAAVRRLLRGLRSWSVRRSVGDSARRAGR